MKRTPPAPQAPPRAKKSGAGKDDSRQWHPSVLEFADGVDVSEFGDTLPGEVWDLFRQDAPDTQR
jgi:hypothetical protein